MNICVVIPCYNHTDTVAVVARSAREYFPVLVVDDGSTVPLPKLPGCLVVRLSHNAGKGAALRAGMQQAADLGYTHVITMDADGQHFAEDLPAFLAAVQARPEALIVGVRNFFAAGCPTHRRRSNAVSTFWFQVETGVRLGDTQCGFRCYPVALARRLQVRSGRYAFELEFMVRASWTGVPIVAVPVKCTYAPAQLRQSHFRPVRDLAHITLMNIGLVLQSWFVPPGLRIAWSLGERTNGWKTLAGIFSDQAQEPGKLAQAVGLGLFFGVAPIWGFQLVATIAIAHRLRLNKAIAAVASNISIPPFAPFILYGGLLAGHRLLASGPLNFSPGEMTLARAREYGGQWLVGSLALAVMVALLGTVITYGVARVFHKK